MGTRYLTIVYLDGKYKVAQYGQWDGEPDRAGLHVLTFLRERMDREKFATAVRASEYLQDTSDWALQAVKGFMLSLDRDTGSDILELLQSSRNGLWLHDDLAFAGNSFLCEWAWVVDLDADTFEAYRGFNPTPLPPGERFAFLNERARRGYYPVIQVRSWQLDRLPSDEAFLEAFTEFEGDFTF